MEQRRVERAMHGLSSNEGGSPDPEEERLKAAIEREKLSYKTNFDRLRELKGEIDYLHKLLERTREQLAGDFESWFKIMLRQQGTGGGQAPASPPPPAKTALQTKVVGWDGSMSSAASSELSSTAPSRSSTGHGSITGNGRGGCSGCAHPRCRGCRRRHPCILPGTGVGECGV